MDFSFQKYLNDKLFTLKEEVLAKVVYSVIGKDKATLHEIKKFEFIYHDSYPNREFVAYDGELIGEIKMFCRRDARQWKMGFDFIPKNKFD